MLPLGAIRLRKAEGAAANAAPRYQRPESSLPLLFQKFIAEHMGPFHTWIGLTESDGSWKWVDGTDYGNSYK